MSLALRWLNSRDYLLALIAGAIIPFAFEPVGFYPLAILMPAVLLALWLRATPTQALCQGLLFGLGMFGVGVSWVFISIHEFGNTAVSLALCFTLLFIGVLAALIGLQGYLLTRFFIFHRCNLLWAFPALWVLMEWVRSWIFSGFPWLLLGYSQIDSPLAGYIPLIGEYGVGLLVTLSSVFLLMGIRAGKKVGYILLALSMIWLTGFALSKQAWTQPQNNKWYKVALIQGDIPQALKWSADYFQQTLTTYLQLTQEHWDKDIVIWPESAIPTAYQYVTDFLAMVNEQAKTTTTALITGIPIQQSQSFEPQFYNALIVLGQGAGTYYKRHLVPFGEYLPFKNLLHGLINFFNIPMSDFIPGHMQQHNLSVKDIPVAPYICYEIAYGEIVRHNLPQALLLVTTSNDSWFGNSMAPWQHLEIGRFRALQTGRYLLFASNSGITAIIDPKGRVVDSIPQFKTAVLTGQVQAMVGVTPWVRWGSTPIILLILFSLLFSKIWFCWRSAKVAK